MEMKKEKEKHAALLKQLSSQIADLKELQKAFEVSLRRKDEVLFPMPPFSETQQTLSRNTVLSCDYPAPIRQSRKPILDTRVVGSIWKLWLWCFMMF